MGIMKAAIATLLMILLVNPQFINASPMPAPNDVECALDPSLCDPSDPKPPPINGACQCNGHLSETHTGLKIGECNQKDGNKGFFCYVDAGGSCCEAESSRYTNYCLNYSICKGGDVQPWQPDIRNGTELK